MHTKRVSVSSSALRSLWQYSSRSTAASIRGLSWGFMQRQAGAFMEPTGAGLVSSSPDRPVGGVQQ
jgi:hypothetical protein